MYKIIAKKEIAPDIISMEVDAPLVAKKARPGQFIILMTDERGERIPLTISDYDPEKGLVRVVFEVLGKTTAKLSERNEGDELFSFVGPLGKPSAAGRYGTVITVGGGLGVSSIYPIARALKEAGNRVIGIIGARTKDLLLLEKEMKEVSDELFVSTNDGSYGRKGLVTDLLEEVLRSEKDVKKVWAIGPGQMMKAVCEVTKPRNLETIVSLNAIMLDGTGMCGTCRATISNKTSLVCVDGPEFNGHLVDWNEFMNRLGRYRKQEKLSLQIYRKTSGDKND